MFNCFSNFCFPSNTTTITTTKNDKQPLQQKYQRSRLAMLAVIGFLAVDAGFYFPGAAAKYSGFSAVAAHDAFVKTGDMAVGLLAIAVVCM